VLVNATQLSNFNSQKVTQTSGFLNDAGVIRILLSPSVYTLCLYLNLESNAGNMDVGPRAMRDSRRDVKFGSMPTSLWVVILPLNTIPTRDYSSTGRPYGWCRNGYGQNSILYHDRPNKQVTPRKNSST